MRQVTARSTNTKTPTIGITVAKIHFSELVAWGVLNVLPTGENGKDPVTFCR